MSSQAVRVIVEPGLQLPWHATASGIALLSALSATERTRLLADSIAAHSPLCEDQITSIHEAIHTASASGYAVSDGRLEQGVTGIAAAVFDSSNTAIATLAVAAASANTTPERVDDIARQVVAAAADLSRRLGAKTKRHILQSTRFATP